MIVLVYSFFDNSFGLFLVCCQLCFVGLLRFLINSWFFWLFIIDRFRDLKCCDNIFVNRTKKVVKISKSFDDFFLQVGLWRLNVLGWSCYFIFYFWMWACCVWFWIFFLGGFVFHFEFSGLATVFILCFIYVFLFCFVSFNLIKIAILI